MILPEPGSAYQITFEAAAHHEVGQWYPEIKQYDSEGNLLGSTRYDLPCDDEQSAKLKARVMMPDLIEETQRGIQAELRRMMRHLNARSQGEGRDDDERL